MVDITARLEFRWKPWASTALVLLVLLALLAQVVHVHANPELSSTPCLACVAAHTAVPATVIAASVYLVAVTLIFVLCDSEAPTSEAVLPLFIRPPPSR